ncbi:MAG: flavodoxin [Bacteroidetes bacterium]|nr:flavodoxin [Bacteroidota bacterium]
MEKISLIYSFNSNKTAKIAERIKESFGETNLETINAETLTEEEFLKNRLAILGVPTWFDGELPNYWDEFGPILEELNLENRVFALYGLGDQKGYTDNFLDAVGIMAEILEKRGAKVVGQTSTDGYHFGKSRALRNGKFQGLAIDFENQASQNSQRVKNWIEVLKQELK